MRKIKIWAVLAIAGLMAFSPPAGHQLNEEDRQELINCWFEDPYSYMFESGDGSTVISTIDYGKYTAGIQGFMFYGSLRTCIREKSNRIGRKNFPGSTALDTYSFLSGVEGAVVQNEEFGFKSIDPKFVLWAAKNIIPEPDEKVGNYDAQHVYTNVFSRYFRLMSKSYLYLEDNDLFEKEWTSYSVAVADGENGMNYLDRRFGSTLALHDLDADWDGTSWTGFMAIGWWLRRYADGSADACWKGLSDMMKSYDKQWFKTLNATDLNVPDTDNVEAVILEKCDCEGRAFIDCETQALPIYASPEASSPLQTLELDPKRTYLYIHYDCMQNGRAKVKALYHKYDDLHENSNDEWWIDLNRMTTSLRTYGTPVMGYSSPKESIPFVKLLGDKRATPAGCSGDWMLIYGYKSRDLQVQAWVKGDDLCPNPYTTCP